MGGIDGRGGCRGRACQLIIDQYFMLADFGTGEMS